MENKKRKPYIPSGYAEAFDFSTFNQRFDELLNQRGMTLIDLSSKLDLDVQSIYRWRNGKRKTPIEYRTICKLARIFHVDEAYLYDPGYTSPHMLDENISAGESTLNEKYAAAIAFLDSIGFYGSFRAASGNGNSTGTTAAYDFILESKLVDRRLSEAEFDALIRKIALFIEMQLL